jgi:hypothetical protein
MAPLRRFRAAVRTGDLQELQASLSATENAMTRLRQQFAEAKKGWSFDVQNYLSSGSYAKEVMAAAQQMGVSMFERDDRLYCYPALLRVAPNEKAVVVDGRWERRIRPAMLVNLLKGLQDRPPRFRPESFLAALFEAYSKIVAQDGDGPLSLSPGRAFNGHLPAADAAAGTGQRILQAGVCPGHLPVAPGRRGHHQKRSQSQLSHQPGRPGQNSNSN